MHDSGSGTTSRRETIRKLEGESDYKPWLTQIRLHLGHRGLWKAASGKKSRPESPEDSDEEEESKALNKKDHLSMWMACQRTTPKAILDTFEQLYGTRGNAARFYRFKDLVTTSLDGCSSVTAYIDTLKPHFKRLDELDGALPE
ncbi:hypothetical protein GP486_007605 [Trichoglossum hirsutum]|uniref:Uncharacterized protein n=1 Tax=Trichoglossum hirsutum TaxID=265104 RepID=A0A9P8IHA5_9PEZI|nr:hypothetical protein GP486_007605 [Trichoglossum hirsutum]